MIAPIPILRGTHADAGYVSAAQLRLYGAILLHWQEHRRSPTIRDLCRLSRRSSNAVYEMLPRLVANGLIRPMPVATARCIVPAMRMEVLQ